MQNSKNLNERFRSVAEITIRLAFLLLLIAWCLRLLYPFSGIIVWGLILALAAAPVYNKLNRRLGNKSKLAAVLLVISALLVIVLPSWLFMDSLFNGIWELEKAFEAGTLSIPPPSEEVSSWPVIGEKIYAIWLEASENLESFIENHFEEISRFGDFFIRELANIGGSMIKLLISIIIAGVLLATSGTEQIAKKFFHKLAGDFGDEFTTVISQTVGSVVKGVIGVAFIQSILIGLGFLLAGVPYAGLWTLVVLVMAILQLPVILVVLPVILWLFSSMGAVGATLWTIYLLLAGASDNILKPYLLGKGSTVPMVVIFLGVIGGFMMSGFIGLFTGAIVISLGYKLFMTWLNSESE